MDVLRSQLVAGVEQPLLLGGQAGHGPPGEAADRSGGRRVVEVLTVQALLAAVARRGEPHGMHVDPATTVGHVLHSDW